MKQIGHQLIQNLKANFFIIQLGDDKEPSFKDTYRYAGSVMRESAAILSTANYFLGPDSLLMHMANGLDIPKYHYFRWFLSPQWVASGTPKMST